MSGRQFTDRDIHMALDGEMPADEQGDFEAWLSVNPDKKALSTRIVEDRRRLREALEPVLREPVPEALRKLVEGDQPAPARRTGWWRLAAAAALLAVGGGAGYALGLSGWKPVGSDGAIIADRAIEAYVIYSAEKLHVVEQRAQFLAAPRDARHQRAGRHAQRVRRLGIGKALYRHHQYRRPPFRTDRLQRVE